MKLYVKILFFSLVLFVFIGCRSAVNIQKKVKNPYNLSQKEKFIALSNFLAEEDLKRSNHKNDEKILLDSVQKAFVAVYGKPYLDKNLKYDAGNEIFYGYIKSTKGGFSKKVFIKVPINDAKSFQRNISELKIDIWFDYDGNILDLSRVVIKKFKTHYLASVENPVFVEDGIISAENMVLMAVNSKNSEITALQKKKAKLEKMAKNKKRTSHKEKILKAQKEALEAQIAMLEKQNGGYDDIGMFLKKAKSHKKDNTRWLFIVAVEKYEYTDPVAYSANSAKDFKKVMKKRLGIVEKNIRTLIDTGATSAKINYRLKDMLRRVKKGDTIYFYYSGHGIPVPSKNNAPYMLAQDMNPAYIDDDRFRLENIYKQLSNSKAGKIIAFVDSCFSGGADNTQLVKGVAATRVKPKRVTFDKSKMVVISAGNGIQYSNKYDKKSNRLFSYYLMRGLIKNNTDMTRLYDYVKMNVAEKSYEMGENYEQVPVYEGNIRMKL